METIHIQPMQWGDGTAYMGSPELQPFSDADATLFKEIRAVLLKHGAINRFGMCLIHKHFEIAEDEELNERTDHEGRTLTIAPRKKAEIDPASSIPTNWRFRETDEVAHVCCTCARNSSGHLGYHRSK